MFKLAAMESDNTPPDDGGPKRKRPPAGEERPFDVWLRKQLHAMYDEVAKEPLPDDLIKLIDNDSERLRAATTRPGDRSKDKPG